MLLNMASSKEIPPSGVCRPLVAGGTDSPPVKEFESSKVEKTGVVRLAETKVPAHQGIHPWWAGFCCLWVNMQSNGVQDELLAKIQAENIAVYKIFWRFQRGLTGRIGGNLGGE